MNESLAFSQEVGLAQWYVMRAYKSEMKAENLLGENNLECFIPKQYAIRTYHGVKSKCLVPIIPSLVFVHASREQLLDFKKQYNFLQFVIWKRKDEVEQLIVPNDQMENFIKVASSQDEGITYYKPDEIDIKKGTRVRIHGGQFDGVTGVFMKVKGKRNRRIVVLLDGIVAVAAEVQPDLIEVLS